MEIYWAYLRVFLALPLVIVLLFFFFRFLKAHSSSLLGSGGRIKVLERVPLGGKAFLYVVRVGEEYLLFSGNGSELKLVKMLPPELYIGQGEKPVEDPAGSPLAFSDLLNKVKRQGMGSLLSRRRAVNEEKKDEQSDEEK